MQVRKSPEWKELFDKAQHWEYDSTHTHEEIAGIINTEVGSQKYRRAVSTCNKKMLLEKQKLVLNIHKVGYRVGKPEEHVKQSLKVWKSSFTRGRKAGDIIDNTRIDLIADQQEQLKVVVVSDYSRRMRLILYGAVEKLQHKIIGKSKIELTSERQKMF